MKVDFTFLHIDSSEALMTHMNQRLSKLERFEFKPMDIHVVFSMDRHECIAEVTIMEGRRKFQARSVTDDFYRTADKVCEKLWRQMSKGKRRIKNHHSVERSHYGQLELLTPELESDFSRSPHRKTG